MPTTTPTPRKKSPKPVAKFRMRVTVEEVIAVGPGKIALLEAIRREGSIVAAAKSIEMSYRRAWLLIEELNQCLKKPAVASIKGGQHGGGTGLTEVGEQLIALYRSIEEKAARACSAEVEQLLKLLGNPR